MTEEIKNFIQQHLEEDTDRLLFSADRFPGINVPFAVEQIRMRRRIREKLPTWYAMDDLVFPSRISAEQCSSEQTALYKQRLLTSEKNLCDLTGGMGVDAWFFSRHVNHVTYVERNKDIFDTAMYNFAVLKADNITGYNATAEKWLTKSGNTDIFYVDPARRSGNVRVFALTDCEPDILKLMPELLKKAPEVIVKLSPMLDITHTLNLLPQTTEVHIVSVKNECKELLFVLKGISAGEPVIRCVNITTRKEEQIFNFTYPEEKNAMPQIANQPGTYLYEPNASILKAGAYKVVACKENLRKLHVNSHLYTSGQLYPNFPGRIFRINTIYPFNGKICKTISKQIPKANLSVRNFPLPVSELRNRTGIKEGGDIYIFATMLNNSDKVLLCCEKAIMNDPFC